MCSIFFFPFKLCDQNIRDAEKFRGYSAYIPVYLRIKKIAEGHGTIYLLLMPPII